MTHYALSITSTMTTHISALKSNKLQKWIKREMNEIIGFEDDEIVRYIMQLDTEESLNEYISAFFPQSAQAQKFCKELMTRRNHTVSTEKTNENSASSGQLDGKTGYSRANRGRGRGRGRGLNRGKVAGRGKKNATKNVLDTKSSAKLSVKKSVVTKQAKFRKEVHKNSDKPKQVHDWYTCKCGGDMLLSNCLSCGKIICSNEGKKYCSHCKMPLYLKSKEIARKEREAMKVNALEAIDRNQPIDELW